MPTRAEGSRGAGAGRLDLAAPAGCTSHLRHTACGSVQVCGMCWPISPKGSKSVVAAALRTIFAQPDRAAAKQQLREVVKAMGSRWPRAADLVAGAEEYVLAYVAFPVEHWTRIYSINPLERLNEEIKGRTHYGRRLPGLGFGAAPGGERSDRGMARRAGRAPLLQPGVDPPAQRARGSGRHRTPTAGPGARQVKRGSVPGPDRGSVQQYRPLTDTPTSAKLDEIPTSKRYRPQRTPSHSLSRPIWAPFRVTAPKL